MMDATVRKLGLALNANHPDAQPPPASKRLEARFLRACKAAGLKPIATLVELREETFVEGERVVVDDAGPGTVYRDLPQFPGSVEVTLDCRSKDPSYIASVVSRHTVRRA